MNPTELREAMAKYRFYHIIKLTDDIFTPGDPSLVPAQDLCMKHLRPLDVRDKRVLDIGCRDGLFSFAAEAIGAGEVHAIDNDLSRGAVEFLIPFFDSKIKMHQMNVYDLKPSQFGSFDIVVFPGVLYHLRYPFWALKQIREVMKIGAHLLIETPIWDAEHDNSVLFCPIGEDSPYEATSCTFFNQKGLADTLKSMGFETISIDYLTRPVKRSRVMKALGGIRNTIRNCLRYTHRAPTQAVNRCVFHCIYHGCDKDSFLVRYWDDTHEFHTSGVLDCAKLK